MSTTDNTYVPKTGINKKYNKSPRVGILTYHRSFNYGSALQSWALSYILTGLGANVEIIDYIPMNYQYIYGDYRKPNSFKNVFFNLIHKLYHGYFVRRKRDFNDFCLKHMPLSDSEFHSARDLKLYLRDFDVVICGSDQIWNPNAEDFDPTYMLSGIEAKRKISYAASIGNGDLNNCENKDEIKRSLLEFEVISIREKSGEKKLKDFLGSEKIIRTVLDPTLLLSQNDFLDNKEINKYINEKYIFMYSIGPSKEVVNAAKFLSKKLNMPVFTLISGSGTGIRNIAFSNEIKIYPGNAGPCGFIELIKNAQFVVTDSFHGTALSIILKKQFLAINNIIKDGNMKNDERLINILSLLNLNERYLSVEECRSFNLDNIIDYSNIEIIRKGVINDSISFLEEYVFKGIVEN